MDNRQIFIQTITPHGAGFGVTVPEGQGVYIPRSIVAACRLEEGDTVVGQVIPNAFKPENCPLMAVRVDKPDRPEPDNALPSTEDEGTDMARDDAANAALELVNEEDDPWTLSDLMDELFGPDTWSRATHHHYMVAISNKLNHAHKRGEIARAEVWQRGGQQKPSRVVWARNWKELF